MDVSIIIPVYNGEKTIGPLLESLARARPADASMQVIVADNGSTDRTREIAERFSFADVVHEPIKTSYAARNRGLMAAKGEVVGFTDADCMVGVNWVKAALRCFSRHDNSMGRQLLLSGPVTPATNGDSPMARYMEKLGNNNTRAAMTRGYFPTANLFVRRDVALAAGGFRQSMFSAGDLDFCWRVLNLGAELGYDEEVAVKHHHRDSVSAMYAQSYKYGAGVRDLVGVHSSGELARESYVKEHLNKNTSISRVIYGKRENIARAYANKALGNPERYYRWIRQIGFFEGYRRVAWKHHKKHPAILSVPDYRRSNSYQTLLYQGLDLPGLSVFYERTLTRALIDRYAPFVNILHIHWLHAIEPRLDIEGNHEKILGLLSYAKQRGMMLMWTMHNLTSHESKEPELERKQTAEIARAFDLILPMSKASSAVLTHEWGIPEKKAVTTPHGVYEIETPYLEPTSWNLKQKLGLSQDTVLCSCFGAVRWYKGFDILVRRWQELTPDNWVLHIAGRTIGYDFKRIVKEAKCDRVIFDERYVPDNELTWMIDHSDLALFPYRRILNSGSVLLCGQLGTPFLASNQGAVRDFVNEFGGIGALIDDFEKISPQAFQGLAREAMQTETPRTSVSDMYQKLNWRAAARPLRDVLWHQWHDIEKEDLSQIERDVARFVETADLTKLPELSRGLMEHFPVDRMRRVAHLGQDNQVIEELAALANEIDYVAWNVGAQALPFGLQRSSRQVATEASFYAAEQFDLLFVSEAPTDTKHGTRILREVNRILRARGVAVLRTESQQAQKVLSSLVVDSHTVLRDFGLERLSHATHKKRMTVVLRKKFALPRILFRDACLPQMSPEHKSSLASLRVKAPNAQVFAYGNAVVDPAYLDYVDYCIQGEVGAAEIAGLAECFHVGRVWGGGFSPL